MRNRTETIEFKSFMDGSFKKPVPKKTNDFKLYSLVGVPVKISAFFDPTIITIGSIVLLIVVGEKLMAHFGLYDMLAKMELFMTFAFPVSVLSFLLYIISHI